jgi:gliding motility-associated-like protein
MKQYFGLISLLLFSVSAFAAASIESKNGFSKKSGNGLLYDSFFDIAGINGDVFIFSGNMEDISIQFSLNDSIEEPTSFKWYEYKEDPEDAVELTEDVDYTVASDGKSSILINVRGNHGYFVEYDHEGCEPIGGRCVKYVWIAIYEPINSVTWDEGIICEDLKLHVKPYMEYVLSDDFGHGKAGIIERKLKITYSTFKREEREVGEFEVSEDQKASTLIILESAPYVDTNFEITDEFGEELKSDSAVFVTETFITSAVIAFPLMSVQNKEENELDNSNLEEDEFGNVILFFSGTPDDEEGSTTQFRTSAPLSVDFVSNASPKVNRYEWHISRDRNFLNSLVYFERDLNSFIISEPGEHYIKLIVWNNTGLPDESCSSESSASIDISTSALHIPNVFTPNGDGINDEFKVAYRSIASYRCRVYNQWGKKVYDSTDITQGWDGTIGGKTASIGAYFYIIDAKGTDGKVYNKRGDINLLRSK